MINLAMIAGIIIAYLLGSIPTAVIVGKSFFGMDIRTVGSGNAGATNTIRTFGMKVGIPVLLFDILKGLAAVKLSLFLNSPVLSENLVEIYKIALGTSAVIGHVFPVFASFRGGKGVATLVGVLIAIYPLSFLIILVCFILIMILSRIVSLSSIICSILFPFIEIFILHETRLPLIILAIGVALFIPYTHRENIKRLLAGTEKKFDFGKNRINK